MKLQFTYPHWGSESFSAVDFFQRVKENGFDGIEINLPENEDWLHSFSIELEKAKQENPRFLFIGQQVLGIESQEYTQRMLERSREVAAFQPDFINSHTGKDYFSFDENCRIIEAAENFAAQSAIPVYHEIHRGRFTFHSRAILPYLEEFPDLKLVADFSHWCVVSESLLQDQQETLEQVFPHIAHLHVRIGTEQASQVNDPFAPEWENHLHAYLNWWKQIIALAKRNGKEQFSITPEFGPFPYMPQAPFSQQPLTDQYQTNLKMKQLLETELTQ